MEERITYPEINSFLRSTIKREDGFLRDLEKYAEDNHIPIIQPETAALLKVLIGIHKPERVLEAGTAIGYSAVIIARAMGTSGTVDTIEIDEDMAEAARKNIEIMDLSKRIRVLQGDALEVMECLDTAYDFIFLDAAKGRYIEYFDHAIRLLRPGGLLVSDNVLYKGLVAQNQKVVHKHRTIAVKLKEYLQLLCHDERLKTSIIPIGDGLAVSLKRS
ncbi:MAG: O-methyltransferase [Clostridiaceae bacterium]|jgi:predicted O-methyltransferase YrrM|nr:O-methyltransferase [Clostridiaceae bacterium]